MTPWTAYLDAVAARQELAAGSDPGHLDAETMRRVCEAMDRLLEVDLPVLIERVRLLHVAANGALVALKLSPHISLQQAEMFIHEVMAIPPPPAGPPEQREEPCAR